MEPIRVYVGTDRSQALAVKVLEYSIKKHTSAVVEVIPMCDLDIPIPKDPKQRQRTGFSFARFCIPKLNGYKGRAIYMDADMMVFKDIRELWNWPMKDYKIAIQKTLTETETQVSANKADAPVKRIRQCAVMLLNCEALDWDIQKIINGLDNNDYTYTQLLHELCLLKDEEIGEILPFEWNSLEHYDNNTRLLHFTDMGTQPWVSTFNKHGWQWLSYVDEMIANGALTLEEVQEEIRQTYFRPSLLTDISVKKKTPKLLWPLLNYYLAFQDKKKGYVMHKKVYEEKKLRGSTP